jgi:hypothetical protein
MGNDCRLQQTRLTPAGRRDEQKATIIWFIAVFANGSKNAIGKQAQTNTRKKITKNTSF